MLKTITFTIELDDIMVDALPIAYDTACDDLKQLLLNTDIESIATPLYDMMLPSVISPSVTTTIITIE